MELGNEELKQILDTPGTVEEHNLDVSLLFSDVIAKLLAFRVRSSETGNTMNEFYIQYTIHCTGSEDSTYFRLKSGNFLKPRIYICTLILRRCQISCILNEDVVGGFVPSFWRKFRKIRTRKRFCFLTPFAGRLLDTLAQIQKGWTHSPSS